MEKIVITGGLGNIGLAVTEALVEQGHQIIIFDYREDVESDIVQNSNVSVVKGDIRDFEHVRRVFIGATGIIHLAALSRVVWGYENPHECVNINILGTANVLEAARVSVRKPWIIFGSSREVYGEPDELPCHESAPKVIANVYGATKMAGENLMEQYHQNYGLNGMIMRFSNVYGSKYDQMDRVIPKFLIRASKSLPLVIQGGEQLFDFTHIDDTRDGILCGVDLLVKKSFRDEPFFDDFHILTGIPTSLQDLAKYIGEMFENQVEIAYAPARQYDVEKFYGDPTKAREILGYEAKISLELGIRMMVHEIAHKYLRGENPLKEELIKSKIQK